ncbi:uncharacterized protein LOC120355632 [Nilaparvata lugens]|uniref:uncharacterized protein LOC120355632 n=1 Tax=Nilaparvata lugens TaxID=108931 RepID=UPI00193DB257|nr:uncharacterized protein LOC120355632 [Nilaparvata lugens]
MESINLFQTSKGKPGIIYKGHKYRKSFSSTVSNRITWRCLDKECAASLKTNITCDSIVDLAGTHTCDNILTHSSPEFSSPSLVTDGLATQVEKQNIDFNQSLLVSDNNSNLLSGPLNDELSQLRTENELLKSRLEELEIQRNAALDRSINLDIQLMQRLDAARDATTQTVKIGDSTPTGTLIDRLHTFINDELLTDNDINVYCRKMFSSYKDLIVVDTVVGSLIVNDNDYDHSFLSSNSCVNRNIAFILNDSRTNNCMDGWTGSHWSLVVFDHIDKTFYNFDSLRQYNNKSLNILIERLKPTFNSDRVVHIDCLQQQNSFDCGIFALFHLESYIKIRNKNNCPGIYKNFKLRKFDAKKQRLHVLNTIVNYLKHQTDEFEATTGDFPQPIISMNNVNLERESLLPKSKASDPIRKIKLFMDSQGRNVVDKLMNDKNEKCQVIGTLKPGAVFQDVTSESGGDCSDLGPLDAAVFIAGTNDIARNEAKNLISVLRRRLSDLRHTRVLVFDVPHRYDLPDWSCVNKLVEWANIQIRKTCKRFGNVTLLELGKLGRRFHTNHGLHLNNMGKRYIADQILRELNTDTSIQIDKPIPLKN